MGKTKFVLNRSEVSKQLLKSSEIQSVVNQVADRLAIAAGPEFYVMEKMHRFRFSATVIDPSDGALQREAEQGNLTKALSALGTQRQFGKKR